MSKLDIRKKMIGSARKILGFTLIELLIVIAVIGVLATAVLSAIDPIEQIKKGRDSTRKSDSAEFLNATERYYTTFEEYPWDADSCSGAGCGSLEDTTKTLDTLSAGPIDELLDKNELKPEFERRPYLAQLYATEEAGSNLVHVCFEPESQTFIAQAVDKQTQRDGTLNAACAAPDGDPSTAEPTACHVCLPQ